MPSKCLRYLNSSLTYKVREARARAVRQNSDVVLQYKDKQEKGSSMSVLDEYDREIGKQLTTNQATDTRGRHHMRGLTGIEDTVCECKYGVCTMVFRCVDKCRLNVPRTK
jgi:hypothetical protein